jgi:hypothetical protein
MAYFWPNKQFNTATYDLELFLQLQLNVLREVNKEVLDIQIKQEHYQNYILYHNCITAPIF